MKSILLNLMINSVKFTYDGYIELKIQKSLDNQSKNLLFTITDTGIGMDTHLE